MARLTVAGPVGGHGLVHAFNITVLGDNFVAYGARRCPGPSLGTDGLRTRKRQPEDWLGGREQEESPSAGG
jgi:hypothetical protein